MTLAPNQAYAWTGQVLNALRGALHDAGFAEILPAILSKRFEPGARHSLAVLGDRALPTFVPLPMIKAAQPFRQSVPIITICQ
jgi:asparaginyl-tRNA synthetase